MAVDDPSGKNPLFSIILTTYNRAGILARSIQSILGQTCSDYELLVVDDASTDATAEVVRQLKTPQLFYLRQEVNQGVGHARNVGIAQARGKFVVFVDDDDTIAPTFLAEVNDLTQTLPESCGFFWTWKRIVQLKGEQWELLRTVTYGYESRDVQPGQRFLDDLPCGSGGLVVRTTCLRAVGAFDEAFRAIGDTELLIRLATHYDFAVIPLALYDVSILGGTQLTKPSLTRAKAHELLIKKHYAIFKQRPHLLISGYHNSAKIYFAAHDAANGRRVMRDLLRACPTSFKSYGLWLGLECSAWLPTQLQDRLLPTRR